MWHRRHRCIFEDTLADIESNREEKMRDIAAYLAGTGEQTVEQIREKLPIILNSNEIREADIHTISKYLELGLITQREALEMIESPLSVDSVEFTTPEAKRDAHTITCSYCGGQFLAIAKPNDIIKCPACGGAYSGDKDKADMYTAALSAMRMYADNVCIDELL